MESTLAHILLADSRSPSRSLRSSALISSHSAAPYSCICLKGSRAQSMNRVSSCCSNRSLFTFQRANCFPFPLTSTCFPGATQTVSQRLGNPGPFDMIKNFFNDEIVSRKVNFPPITVSCCTHWPKLYSNLHSSITVLSGTPSSRPSIKNSLSGTAGAQATNKHTAQRPTKNFFIFLFIIVFC